MVLAGEGSPSLLSIFIMSEIVKKRVAVVGSRTFCDRKRLYDVLTKNRDRIKLIVSGGAAGADTLAVNWATDYGIPYLVFPALWRDPDTGEYNRGAGFKRNRLIVEQSDVVVAFWDGQSKGTEHTLETARQLGKDIRIIRFEMPAEPKAYAVDFKSPTGLATPTPEAIPVCQPTISPATLVPEASAQAIAEKVAELLLAKEEAQPYVPGPDDVL